MKKLAVISKISLILLTAIVLPFSAQSQDTQTPTYSRSAEQDRPVISGQLLAYHDLKKDSQSEEDMDLVDILIFIDESVAKGTLAGKGSGNSADARLDALVQRIELAGENLWNNTSFEEVCWQLSNAYLRTDGLNEPSDLVHGPGSEELAKKINFFKMEVVGCEADIAN
jgi:hypothetical protein